MNNLVRIPFQQSLIILFLFSLMINFLGCIATTNYYTGRTLKKGRMMISFGLDNIIIQSTDDGLSFNMKMPVSPSLGLALGLPYGFEGGLYHPRNQLSVYIR